MKLHKNIYIIWHLKQVEGDRNKYHQTIFTTNLLCFYPGGPFSPHPTPNHAPGFTYKGCDFSSFFPFGFF